MAIRSVQYAAMGHRQYAFSGMLADHVGQEGDDAGRKFAETFSAFQRQVRVARLEDLPGMRMSGAGFGPGQTLQHAEMSLAKSGVLHDALHFAYRGTCGAISALQITCIYGVEMLAGGPLSDRLGLRFAQFIQCDVDMTLNAALRIPRGFTMADHYQPGKAHRWHRELPFNIVYPGIIRLGTAVPSG